MITTVSTDSQKYSNAIQTAHHKATSVIMAHVVISHQVIQTLL